MTDLEQRAVRALLHVAFGRDRVAMARVGRLHVLLCSEPHWSLDRVDSVWVWRMVWRYRRQIQDAQLVAHADEVVNVALPLAFGAPVS